MSKGIDIRISTNYTVGVYELFDFKYNEGTKTVYKDEDLQIDCIKRKICESIEISDILIFIAILMKDINVNVIANYLYDKLANRNTKRTYRYNKHEVYENGELKEVDIEIIFE